MSLGVNASLNFLSILLIQDTKTLENSESFLIFKLKSVGVQRFCASESAICSLIIIIVYSHSSPFIAHPAYVPNFIHPPSFHSSTYFVHLSSNMTHPSYQSENTQSFRRTVYALFCRPTECKYNFKTH